MLARESDAAGEEKSLRNRDVQIELQQLITMKRVEFKAGDIGVQNCKEECH